MSRNIFFFCMGIKNGVIYTGNIPSSDKEKAKYLFAKQNPGIEIKQVEGPFVEKRSATKFDIFPYSDDVISYSIDGKIEQLDTAEQNFSITLPDGTDISVLVFYTDGSWTTSINLPKGSTVKKNDSKTSNSD